MIKLKEILEEELINEIIPKPYLSSKVGVPKRELNKLIKVIPDFKEKRKFVSDLLQLFRKYDLEVK